MTDKGESFNTYRIGNIGNHYGDLCICTVDGKHYWGIRDWDDCYEPQEIPKSLYVELYKYRTKESVEFWGIPDKDEQPLQEIAQ